jgi:hypothetical protein
MADYTIPSTDRIDIDIGTSCVRLRQTDARGEESIIWIDSSQLARVADYLAEVANRVDFDE